KRLELVREAWPSAARVGILFNPGNPVNAALMRAMQLTANSLKLELYPFEARSPDEFGDVLAKAAGSGVELVAATSDAVIRANARRLAEIATSHRLPSIGDNEFGHAGGLIGYGVNLPDLWYRGAFFVDRVLKGARPADLPVEQPTKFELNVNLKTARAARRPRGRPRLARSSRRCR